MMDRDKGFFAWIIIAAIFGLGIVMFFLSAGYSDQVMTKAQNWIAKNYESNAFGEPMLELPCATASRGVYYYSSVISGDLQCIEPVGQVTHVQFKIGEDEVYDWRIERTDDGKTVRATDSGQYTQAYPILVENSRTGEVKRATMQVGVELEEE